MGLLQRKLHNSLEALGVDQIGLDEVDRNLLISIIDKFSGGPVGFGYFGGNYRGGAGDDRRCI